MTSLRQTRCWSLDRGRDIAAVKQSLSNGATRFVSLMGPGSVGKTQLALEVAEQLAAASCR